MQQNPNLTDKQKDVLFNHATEHPFTGEFLNKKDDGVYTCANCGSRLFDSSAKFDSGSGWPSFDSAIKGAVTFKEDNTLFMRRTEVTCTHCGGHLGHVFDDGPKTTGKRYCINSCALGFGDREDT